MKRLLNAILAGLLVIIAVLFYFQKCSPSVPVEQFPVPGTETVHPESVPAVPPPVKEGKVEAEEMVVPKVPEEVPAAPPLVEKEPVVDEKSQVSAERKAEVEALRKRLELGPIKIGELEKPVSSPEVEKKKMLSGKPTWQITYFGKLAITGADVVIVDLFDFSAGDVDRLKQAGSIPIAYFSAHYEDWRPDAGSFGKKLKKIGGWKGEYYVDWKDKKNQAVMKRRLDRARSMGFEGVDIDNVDGPGGNGYFPWLMQEAKSRGLLVGLKNFVEILPSVGHQVDFFVSEASVKSELDCYRKYSKPTVRMYYHRGAATPDFIYEVVNKRNGSRF